MTESSIVEQDVWGWAAGQNFITKISDALHRHRVVALWSAECFNRSRFSTQEWSAALTEMPVRIDNMPVGQVLPILRPMQYQDLFGLEDDGARRVLLLS